MMSKFVTIRKYAIPIQRKKRTKSKRQNKLQQKN